METAKGYININTFRYYELKFFCLRWKTLDEFDQALIKDCAAKIHPTVKEEVLNTVITLCKHPLEGKSEFFRENYWKFFGILDERKGSYDVERTSDMFNDIFMSQ